MIYVLSGGGSKVVASIVVIYPVGSTCTCTLGSKVLTAKNTSGKWVFGLPSIGDWVVKITNGSKSRSMTVSITAENQVKEIELAYEFILFNSALTTSYSLSGKNITPAVNVTDFTTLEVHGYPVYLYAAGYYTVWGLRQAADASLAVSVTINYDKTFIADITSLKGNYFFGAQDNISLASDGLTIRNNATAAIGAVEYIKFSL